MVISKVGNVPRYVSFQKVTNIGSTQSYYRHNSYLNFFQWFVLGLRVASKIDFCVLKIPNECVYGKISFCKNCKSGTCNQSSYSMSGIFVAMFVTKDALLSLVFQLIFFLQITFQL